MGRRNRRNIYHYNGPEEDKKEFEGWEFLMWIVIIAAIILVFKKS